MPDSSRHRNHDHPTFLLSGKLDLLLGEDYYIDPCNLCVLLLFSQKFEKFSGHIFYWKLLVPENLINSIKKKRKELF